MTSHLAIWRHGIAAILVYLPVVVALTACGGGSGSDRIWFTEANSPQVDNLRLVTTIGQPVSGHVTGTDIDGDALAFFMISEPFHGEQEGLPPGPGAWESGSDSGYFTYQPDPGFVGEDRFRFIANDGDWNSRHGAVVIDVRPVAFGNAELQLEQAVPAENEKSAPDWTGRWLPVFHPLPDDGQGLYVLDLQGIEAPLLVASSGVLDRITRAVAIPYRDAVVFRVGSALRVWRASQGNMSASTSLLYEADVLGEFVLSEDGQYLAFTAGRRDEPGLQLFIATTNRAGISTSVELNLSGPLLFRNLRFDGPALRTDAYQPGVSPGCGITVIVSSSIGGPGGTSNPIPVFDHGCFD